MTIALLTEELKNYLRIDDNENLSLYLQSAILFLANAGVSKPTDLYEKKDDLDIRADYRLAACILSTHFYENRIVINPITVKVAQIPIPYGLESMILQLKWVDVE